MNSIIMASSIRSTNSGTGYNDGTYNFVPWFSSPFGPLRNTIPFSSDGSSPTISKTAIQTGLPPHPVKFQIDIQRKMGVMTMSYKSFDQEPSIHYELVLNSRIELEMVMVRYMYENKQVMNEDQSLMEP
jgi:hypothetical protein